MDAFAGSFAGTYVSRDAGLAREFEERLADCPALAFRVALGVLRNRAEAEDVAQDALVRAYRNFHRLRAGGDAGAGYHRQRARQRSGRR